MKARTLGLFIIVLLAVASALPLLASAKIEDEALIVMELRENQQVTIAAYPSSDDSMTNPDYALTGYTYTGYGLQGLVTANYWINPNNKYRFSVSAVETTIKASANTWDAQTSFQVFSYRGTTGRSAGRRDGYNVIDWGSYRNGVIAVTMFWVSGSKMVEIDMRMNTLYKWSLSGEAGKMDVQNIVTHEFGHWAGLNDLYADADYWLTMFGYSNYGITYQRTLGLGDQLGIQNVYGPP